MVAIAFALTAPKCITTRSSTITATRQLRELLSTTAPWLRVPIDMIDSSYFGDYDNFYNIVDKRLFKLEHHNDYGVDSNLLCVGSSRGSLAFICQNGRLYFRFPHDGGGYKYNNYGDQDEEKIDKTNSGLHSLTRFYTNLGYTEAFFCYPRYLPKIPTPNNYHDFYVGNEDDYKRNWTRYPNLFHKDDPPIVYCFKSKTVYKLSCCGYPWVVELWDIPDHRINVTCRINVGHMHESSYEINSIERELRARCHQDRHLVLTGDKGGRGDPVLYLVVRYHNRELGVSETRAVDVFRFGLVGGKMNYTKNLDDHAFFIGKRSDSFAVPVEQCGPGGLKPDSVYIADDLRVFDLKDGSVTPILDTGGLSMTRFQSLWVSPPTSNLTRRENLDVTQKNRDLWVQCENCYFLNFKKLFTNIHNCCGN